MSTLVCFHAHPDDESIATGGTMAKAAASGHRVVLVTATRGEQGEPVPGVLGEGEALGERRFRETHRSGEVLGVQRVEFLGYEDSGMMGESTNDNPGCFWQADLDEAAGRLAEILREVGADVLTIYDEHGGYGHPDHIQVHRVGRLAAEMAAVPAVFQATMNRTRIQEMMTERAAELEAAMEQADMEGPGDDFGTPEDQITHAVDVVEFIDVKHRSMRCHESQISEESFFMQMPPEVFAMAFGTEWFVQLNGHRAPGEPFRDDLFGAVTALSHP